MTKTVRERWGCGISVWIKRLNNILSKIISKINIKKNKEGNNMKHIIATRCQKKMHILCQSMLTFKRVYCWV